MWRWSTRPASRAAGIERPQRCCFAISEASLRILSRFELAKICLVTRRSILAPITTHPPTTPQADQVLGYILLSYPFPQVY